MSEYMTVGGELTSMELKCIRIKELEKRYSNLAVAAAEYLVATTDSSNQRLRDIKEKALMRVLCENSK
jgi:hypothetical protein